MNSCKSSLPSKPLDEEVTLTGQSSILRTSAPVNLKAILKHPAIDAKSSVTEKFFEQIPLSFKNNYVLMHHSECLGAASYEKPKVILFASSTPAYASINPTDKSIFLLQPETISEKRAVVPGFTRKIVWQDNDTFSTQENPSECVVCHGKSNQPIWDAFPLFPGSYGSLPVISSVDAPQTENEQFRNFLGKSKDSLPYRTLKHLDNYYERLPTRLLAEKIAQNSPQFILQKIENVRHYSQLKFAIQGALQGCSKIDEFIPTKLRKIFQTRVELFLSDTSTTIAQSFEERKSIFSSHNPTLSREMLASIQNFSSSEPYNRRVAFLRFLLDRDDFYLATLFAGVIPGSYTTGYTSALTGTLSNLHRERSGINTPADCDMLKLESLKSLDSIKEKDIRSSQPISTHIQQPFTKAKLGDFKNYREFRAFTYVTQSCISCHQPSEKSPSKMSRAFTDTQSMRAFLKGNRREADIIQNISKLHPKALSTSLNQSFREIPWLAEDFQNAVQRLR